jgi:multiple sugar transport system substrate-binding protein
MRYPDGSNDIWGLPQEGDTMALYVRKDLVEDPKEQEAFQAKYNMKLPSTFEDYENLNADDYEKVMGVFHPAR